MTRKLTQEEFMHRALEANKGSILDVSAAVYKSSSEKVEVTCAKHGTYYASAYSVMQGRGCKKCTMEALSSNKPMTQDEFIARASAALGDKLDLSEAVYKKANEKVKVVCKQHGEKWMIASSLLLGVGCWECGVLKRSGVRGGNRYATKHEVFVQKAVERYGEGKFDYADTVLTKMKCSVSIRCVKHDTVFNQVASAHVAGTIGCPACIQELKVANGRLMALTTSEFVEKAVALHGDTYDYSHTTYISSKSSVDILCNQCGNIFSQMPFTHLEGSGCPSCAKRGFDPVKPAIAYVKKVQYNGTVFTGYGITGDFSHRMCAHRRNTEKAGAKVLDLFVSKVASGKLISEMERDIAKTFPRAEMDIPIEGFVRENTSAPFEEVVAFVQKYLENREGS